MSHVFRRPHDYRRQRRTIGTLSAAEAGFAKTDRPAVRARSGLPIERLGLPDPIFALRPQSAALRRLEAVRRGLESRR